MQKLLDILQMMLMICLSYIIVDRMLTWYDRLHNYLRICEKVLLTLLKWTVELGVFLLDLVNDDLGCLALSCRRIAIDSTF